MADQIFQVNLQMPSGLPEDVAVNVLYFDTDDVEGTCDGIAEAYNTVLGGFLQGSIDEMFIKVYDLAGGQPIFTKTYAATFSGGQGPHEVAICLSYAADDGETTARRRGRIYIGPLSGRTTDRPDTNTRSQILDFGEALASIGTALATTWKMYSRSNSSTHKIEQIWVDDAWDTQRRRGVAPTTREIRDVQ